MRTQMGTGSTAFYQPYGTRLLVPAHRSNSTKLVRVMTTKMKGKHTGRTVNGRLGYETNFFPGFGWKGEWHSSLSLSQDSFSSLPSQHCKLRNHALLWHSERSSSNSSSALQLPLFLRFVQIEPYFVSNLLRVLHTSKVREIILNTASVCADEDPETQTKPLACGFFHCVKQRPCCCSHCRCSLYSAALNLFLIDGAEESPFPGNHPRHLPLHFKPLENPEAHTRRIQDFFFDHTTSSA